MLKVTSVIFFITVNISQINVFQIDGLFSSAHLDSLENHFVQNTYSQEDLFVIQYSADDHTKGTIDKFNFLIMERSQIENFPKAIWVGPHKTSINAELLNQFDYIGFTPGTVIYNVDFSDEILVNRYCGDNSCNFDEYSVSISENEGIYNGYLVSASLGGFLNTLGSDSIESNLFQENKEGSSRYDLRFVQFGLNDELSNQIDFYKPTLLNRVYIAVSNPAFSYLFFVLGLALIVLELFAMGPGIMAFIGGVLLLISSMTFNELGVNNYGILILFLSFLMYVKVLARGYFSLMGLTAFIVQFIASIVLFSDSIFKDGTSHSVSVSIFSLALVSIGLAIFYFVAIPTVIRSRLTTDNSAITSLVGGQAQYISKVDSESSLFSVNDLQVKIKHPESKELRSGESYTIKEEDGSLTI